MYNVVEQNQSDLLLHLWEVRMASAKNSKFDAAAVVQNLAVPSSKLSNAVLIRSMPAAAEHLSPLCREFREGDQCQTGCLDARFPVDYVIRSCDGHFGMGAALQR